MAAETIINMESTVDIIAASGPAMKIPAKKGDISLTVSVGIARSPVVIPGSTARPIAPTKCMTSMVKPTTNVPIIIALCSDFESLKPSAFCVVCGSPRIAKPTSTQKERINGLGTAFEGPRGESSSGSMALSPAIIPSTPPPAVTTANNIAEAAINIIIP